MKQITCPHCGDTFTDFDVAHVCSRGPYAVKLKPKMNERIQELRDEILAEAYQKQQGMDWVMERFAELIVRECIGVIGEENYTMLTGKAYCTELKRHFGVEE